MKFLILMSFIQQVALNEQWLQASKHEEIHGNDCFQTFSQLLKKFFFSKPVSLYDILVIYGSGTEKS